MKTKIVYVLVSQESDYYYEMFLLSLYTLRLYHPKGDTEVVVVMDEDTHQRLVDKKAEMLNDVTPIVVDIPSEYTIMQRSRYLKTHLRQIINGDFLYIDVDTVICDSLEDVDKFSDNIGAVLDNHHGGIIEWQVKQIPDELNWKYLTGSKHFNSGVIYVKDYIDSYSFFEQWHNNWKVGASFGCNFDQLSLRKTVLESNIEVGELDGIWNCQISRTSSNIYKKRAKIIHYQGSFTKGYAITSEEVFLKIRNANAVTEHVAEALRKPRQAFDALVVYVTQRELDYLKSPLLSVYKEYPRFYSFLVWISLLYKKIRRVCS